MLLIFVAVIGGIYGGLFMPTEAASIGVIATGITAWSSGGLRGKGFLECLYGTARGTGMVFLILLGMEYWGLGLEEKAIWFGMVALVVMEIGPITSPATAGFHREYADRRAGA